MVYNVFDESSYTFVSNSILPPARYDARKSNINNDPNTDMEKTTISPQIQIIGSSRHSDDFEEILSQLNDSSSTLYALNTFLFRLSETSDQNNDDNHSKSKIFKFESILYVALFPGKTSCDY